MCHTVWLVLVSTIKTYSTRISEPKMFEAVKHTLMRSLRQVVLTQAFVRSKGVEVFRKI